MDIRRWGPGERLVFEPYTKEAGDETFAWIARPGIFAETGRGHRGYEDSVMSLETAGWLRPRLAPYRVSLGGVSLP